MKCIPLSEVERILYQWDILIESELEDELLPDNALLRDLRSAAIDAVPVSRLEEELDIINVRLKRCEVNPYKSDDALHLTIEMKEIFDYLIREASPQPEERKDS